jgi:hypothetical protein
MSIEMTAAVADSGVVALPIDRAGWMAWLIENTEGRLAAGRMGCGELAVHR